MSRLSRREFLENSMLATVTAAAATYAPTSLNAFEDKTSKSPNERLRVAVLGVNGRGRTHIDSFLRRNDCQVAAIVDPDENVGMKKGVARVEKKTGEKPAFYQDLRRVMDDKSIDIISIATPNHWHSLAAIWAMQAGKDVYLEKPISHNVSEGRRVVQAARKYNQICQAGTQCRTMPGTVDAIKFLHAGGVGDVKLARGLCYKPRKSIGPKGLHNVPKGVDYNLWLGPAPLMKQVPRPRFHYDWHWQWDYGNADMGNQGIHQMDIARWGLGVDSIGDSVLSYGGRLGYEDAGQTANTQVNIHGYGDKTIVFETRGLKTGAYRKSKIGVIFQGSKGYVVQAKYNYSMAFDLKGKMIKEFKGGFTYEHFDNFIDGVRSRKVSDLNGDVIEGHLSSALCHLGNISYRLGKKISVAEIKERLAAVKSSDNVLETFERTAKHLAENKVDIEKTKLAFGPLLMVDSKNEAF
ncbi:Myo-inositol 2-dehydrogenase, partial [hydrothermal vent metagenome]